MAAIFCKSQCKCRLIKVDESCISFIKMHSVKFLFARKVYCGNFPGYSFSLIYRCSLLKAPQKRSHCVSWAVCSFQKEILRRLFLISCIEIPKGKINKLFYIEGKPQKWYGLRARIPEDNHRKCADFNQSELQIKNVTRVLSIFSLEIKGGMLGAGKKESK